MIVQKSRGRNAILQTGMCRRSIVMSLIRLIAGMELEAHPIKEIEVE